LNTILLHLLTIGQGSFSTLEAMVIVCSIFQNVTLIFSLNREAGKLLWVFKPSYFSSKWVKKRFIVGRCINVRNILC